MARSALIWPSGGQLCQLRQVTMLRYQGVRAAIGAHGLFLTCRASGGLPQQDALDPALQYCLAFWLALCY
jgi:hypothetical protein